MMNFYKMCFVCLFVCLFNYTSYVLGDPKIVIKWLCLGLTLV